MEVLSYLLLGLVQGLTEFLPVSSSGHLTLGQAILGLGEEDLTFTVLVHAATALSTVVVFREDILGLVRDVFTSGDSGATARSYTGLLLLSAVPAAVLGLGFKDAIEALATPKFVGAMLCVTALVLLLSQRASGGTDPWARDARWASGWPKPAPSFQGFPALGPPSGPRSCLGFRAKKPPSSPS